MTATPHPTMPRTPDQQTAEQKREEPRQAVRYGGGGLTIARPGMPGLRLDLGDVTEPMHLLRLAVRLSGRTWMTVDLLAEIIRKVCAVRGWKRGLE